MTGCAVAVIGHVDHGKTALVRALTGMETDRLAEEKARGLSISLGYAHRAYARGVLDIIDAPGHEDFIRAMVCGTTGAAAVLLVVSAIDGVQPQTREHLAIAGHLGLRRGVVAISRIDQIGPEARDACRSAIMEALSETPLGDAPVCLCSAMTGEGLGQLHAALAGLVESASALTPPSLPATFLPIDRVFSATGAGTVVTGTLQGARLARGAEMVLETSGRRAGVRGLQVNGLDVSVAMPGRRVAANLRGVQAGAVQRGDVLAAPGAFPASSCMDVRVALSPTASRALKHLDAVRLMIGTASEMAQIRLLAQQDIAPGRSGHAQLRLARPVSVHAGQIRFTIT